MATDVELDKEVLLARLHSLINLHDNVKILQETLQDLRGRQTQSAWSATGAATGFAQSYRTSLGVLETELATLRTRISTFHDQLKTSADELTLRDEEVQLQLAQLAARESADAAMNAPVFPLYMTAAARSALGPTIDTSTSTSTLPVTADGL